MPQIMEEQEQDKTYHKSIDSLIEDAEIEAEIEAEKTIRSKNARLLSISLVGIALIAFIYLQVNGTTSPKENDEIALPELTESPPASELPGAETSPAPVTDQAPAVSEKPEPQTADTTEVEPEASKAAPEPPVEKPKKPAIAKAVPKEPTPQPIVKIPAVVPPPTKILSPDTPSVQKHFVQLGLFSIEDNAKGFARQIKKKGFKPSIQVKTIEADKYVVFVGGFSTKESGGQAFNDLKAKGFNSVMEKLADNSYTIVLGKFVTSDQAEALRDKLSIEGFLSSSRKSKVNSKIYIVQLGAFDSIPQAKVMQKKIERAGFNGSFIR